MWALTLIAALALAAYVLPPNAQQTQPPQEPSQAHNLTVVTLWDGNHDGTWEGVGPGRQAQLYKNGQAYLADYTDSLSEAHFLVDQGGNYAVNVRVPSTRFLLVWVCQENFAVGQGQNYIVVECFERFFLRLPFGVKGVTSE